jgi:hypothetical protein
MTSKKYSEPLEYLFGSFHKPLNSATKTAYEIELSEKHIDAGLVYQTAQSFVRSIKKLPESVAEFVIEAQRVDGRRVASVKKSRGCNWCEEGSVYYWPGDRNSSQTYLAPCALCRVDHDDRKTTYIDPRDPKITLDYLPKAKQQQEEEEEIPF